MDKAQDGSINVLEMWQHTGGLDQFVVAVLVVMAVYSLWVVIDRLYVFGRARRQSEAFVAGLKGHLLKRDLAAALALARAESMSPVAKVVASALAEQQDAAALDALNRVVERAKEREVAGLKRGLAALASIASAAPLVGLFGTLSGIVGPLRTLGASGQIGAGAVAVILADAIVTTAAGLVVAIPSKMMSSYFRSAVDAFIVDMNDVSAELLRHLLREGLAR